MLLFGICTNPFRGPEAKEMTFDTIDETFMWNSYMMTELIKFRSRLPLDERRQLDKNGFLTTAIRGFTGTSGFRLGTRSAHLTVISRQSWKRAGTRFNARGVDDEGNVANFVETETILCIDNGKCMGYTQVRGSVPAFWEQDANLISAKINLTRSLEATQPAFNRHFDSLIQRFGSVQIVNLLADKSGEIDLSMRYREHVKASPSLSNIGLTEFDFHSEVSNGGYALASKIVPKLQDPMLEFGFYSYDSRTGKDQTEQVGVFRTNCLDCLDRTNMIQQLLSREALLMFLEYEGIPPGQEIWNKHNFLWADNGDQLSQIYAGTNALKTSFTRSGKMNLAGALADVTKSVGRMYINNFVDKGRQNTIDLLLGRAGDQLKVVLHDPINDYVTAELNKRQQEFASSRHIKIFGGTLNLNGVLSEQDLSAWLFPSEKDAFEPADLYLIGFQEIVELTAQQILNADLSRKEFWEKQVLKCLNKFGNYVLLRSSQLVGTALMLFAKKEEVINVTKVEGALKKTGLGGMAGNKGGVAVSFNFCDTSFCFITAHLAAGTNNVIERHNDYKTLSSGLRFSRGKKIKDHDTVIWLGDFNYRVDLPNDQVRKLIQAGDFGKIFEHDQLNLQMVKGETFPYYNEAQVTFPPTYKFDNGTDNYDTSEKARTPSWTDRILSRGLNIKQESYGSALLRFSDHRPVYASFRAKVVIVDREAKEKLSLQLYDQRRAEVGDTNDLVNLIDLNENMLSHGLPPPSSDQKKWWISGEQSAKVNLLAPEKNMVINPDRPSNPFTPQSNASDDFVPPLPPRPETATPPATNSKGKIAPAVPRKPVGLNTHRTSSAELSPKSPTGSVSSRESIPSTVNSKGATPPPPPPPRGSRTSSLSSKTSKASKSSSLLDDAPTDVNSSWTPLQPNN